MRARCYSDQCRGKLSVISPPFPSFWPRRHVPRSTGIHQWRHAVLQGVWNLGTRALSECTGRSKNPEGELRVGSGGELLLEIWGGGCCVTIAQWSYRLPSLSAATATADELLRSIIWYRLGTATLTHTHTNTQRLLVRWPVPRATGHLAVTSKWWLSLAHQINGRHRPYIYIHMWKTALWIKCLPKLFPPIKVPSVLPNHKQQ